MISISEALKIIERETSPLQNETVELNEAVGRVLAEEIFADTDLPPFNRSQMDGFAVRTKDIKTASETNPVKLKIIGESAAGKGFDNKLKKGEAIRIMTGARVPQGADAVQKRELAREFQANSGELFVEIFAAPKAGQYIVKRATEIIQNTKVFEKGEVINPLMIAALASFGYARVKVFRQPIVSIIATGSEIVSVDQKPKQDQIRDANSSSLKAFAEQVGAIAEILPRSKDDFDSLKQRIAEVVGLNDKSQIANRKSQILILSGGVSVGDYDFTKPVLRSLGTEVFFEKVALRPGKPTVFAKLNDCFVFGLPGNPVSAAVTFYLFVRKAILRMQGARDCGLKEAFAVLSGKLKGAKERDSYIPARLNFNEKGQVMAAPLKWGGSSDFVAFSKADCLIFVPQNAVCETGTIIKIALLP